MYTFQRIPFWKGIPLKQDDRIRHIFDTLFKSQNIELSKIVIVKILLRFLLLHGVKSVLARVRRSRLASSNMSFCSVDTIFSQPKTIECGYLPHSIFRWLNLTACLV